MISRILTMIPVRSQWGRYNLPRSNYLEFRIQWYIGDGHNMSQSMNWEIRSERQPVRSFHHSYYTGWLRSGCPSWMVITFHIPVSITACANQPTRVLNTKNWNDHPKYAAKLKNDFDQTPVHWFMSLLLLQHGLPYHLLLVNNFKSHIDGGWCPYGRQFVG